MKKSTFIKRTVVIFLLTIMAASAFLWAYLYAALNSMQDRNIKIVDRTGDYSVPLLPDDEIIPVEETDTTAPEVTDNPPHSSEPDTTTAPQTPNPPQPEIPYVEPTYPVRHTNIYKKEPIDPDVWNILLLGRDTEGSLSIAGRTDAMIVLSYNKKTHQIKMVSLMRDSLVPIEGYGWNRINTPYFFGGAGLAVNTVNDVFGLDIQNYIVINFSGMKDLIDEFGGVDIVLTQEEANYYNSQVGYDLPVGAVTLTGAQAMTHMRNRSIYNSDFARTQRQRDVLISLYNKIMIDSDASKIVSLINYSMNKVTTNLQASDLIFLATNAAKAGKQEIVAESMPFAGTYGSAWYKGMLIIQIDILENRRLIHQLFYG